MKRSIIMLAAVVLLAQSCYVRINGKRLNLSTGSVEDSAVVLRDGTLPSGLDEIALTASFDVQFIQSDECRYEVSAPENRQEYIELAVEENRLIIRAKEQEGAIWFGSEPVVIRVWMPVLNRVSVTGSGDFSAPSIQSGPFHLVVTGSGDVSVEKLAVRSLSTSLTGSGDITVKGLETGELVASVTGSGDISLSGKADHAYLSVSGSGDIHARNLVCPSVENRITGSGDIVLPSQ